MGFYIERHLPDLSAFTGGFPQHYLNVIFRGNVPQDFSTRALTSTFVRLTEIAVRQYESGRACLEEFWDKRRSGSFPIGIYINSSGYFESCITNMHRATECMRAIRGRRHVQQDIKNLLPRPRFVEEPVAERLRKMRNAVHHFEKEILDGRLKENTNFCLRADGPQIKRGEDTVQLIDRLSIGQLEIEFSDLCQWLREMAQSARVISSYERPGPTELEPAPS